MHVVRVSDGLGNQMFQYAFARKIQILSGRKVYLDVRFINHEDLLIQGKKNFFSEKCDCRKYELHHFKITLPIANEDILFKWKFLSQENNMKRLIYKLAQMYLWPWQYRNEMGKGNILNLKTYIFPTYFQGYFFSLEYYNDIKSVLQREFCVKMPICLSSELRETLKNDNTVGVHIRRGDFLRVFRDISQKNYYPRALERMSESIEEPVYLIFSDDIEWVKKNIEINGRKIYISEMGFLDYEELTIMKHCKHNIIANSTFSYWAAYLNDNPDKIVICPKRWKVSIVPNDWICI